MHHEGRRQRRGSPSTRDLASSSPRAGPTGCCGGGAVDLVGQDDVGEDRPAAEGEVPRLRLYTRDAEDVGGQQVGRELDAAELAARGRGPGPWPASSCRRPARPRSARGPRRGGTGGPSGSTRACRPGWSRPRPGSGQPCQGPCGQACRSSPAGLLKGNCSDKHHPWAHVAPPPACGGARCRGRMGVKPSNQRRTHDRTSGCARTFLRGFHGRRRDEYRRANDSGNRQPLVDAADLQHDG